MTDVGMDNRVLAFGCHPDDIEFCCSGTLALFARRGYEIHLAVMAGGEMGSPELPPQKIRERRLEEATASAAVLDGHFHYAGGYDIEVEYSAEYRRRSIRILREVDPFLVFTGPPMDYLIDHEETSRLVRNACFIASVPNYDCGVPTKPTVRIPHLYYWNAFGQRDIFGRPLPVTRMVDISSVMEIKTRMLACHSSQRQWLAYHNGWDEYLESMRREARAQGERIGSPAGEGFFQHLGAQYPQNDILKEILGDLCVEI